MTCAPFLSGCADAARASDGCGGDDAGGRRRAGGGGRRRWRRWQRAVHPRAMLGGACTSSAGKTTVDQSSTPPQPGAYIGADGGCSARVSGERRVRARRARRGRGGDARPRVRRARFSTRGGVHGAWWRMVAAPAARGAMGNCVFAHFLFTWYKRPYSTRLRVKRLRVGIKGFYSASVRRAPRSCAQQNLRPVACGCCRTCLGRRLSIRRRHDVVVPRSWCARRTRLARPGGAARLYAACSARYTLLPAAALVDSCESARAEAL